MLEFVLMQKIQLLTKLCEKPNRLPQLTGILGVNLIN